MTQGDPPQQSDWREIGRRHEATYWVALIVILTLVILFDKETFSLYRVFTISQPLGLHRQSSLLR